ncbi:unnamed protein product [Amoebophrya sp. A25]|nr:unnamed protein product [Amoebophrya sp. A25]|eukprot:GSA25T00018229001.1
MTSSSARHGAGKGASSARLEQRLLRFRQSMFNNSITRKSANGGVMTINYGPGAPSPSPSSTSLNAYYIPHNDAHFSEYICERDERLGYISGFTGSAGTAVITPDEALLWTDGRYFLQAEDELGKGWKLMKQGQCETPREWLVNKQKEFNNPSPTSTSTASTSTSTSYKKKPQASTSSAFTTSVHSPCWKVGMDPWLISVKAAQKWETDLGKEALSFEGTHVTYNVQESSNNKELLTTSNPALKSRVDVSNPVDSVRLFVDKEAISRPKKPIRHQPLRFSGETVSSKLARLREEMKSKDVSACLVCALDDICWMLNLRGSDIPYNPVFFAFLLVFRDETKLARLYCDRTDLGREHADDEDPVWRQVEVKKYEHVEADLKLLFSRVNFSLWVDEDSCPQRFKLILLKEIIDNFSDATSSSKPSDSAIYTKDPLPIKKWKSVKNDVELEGMKQAHLRDGFAKTKYIMWLQDYYSSGSSAAPLTEVSAASKLEQFRRENEFFQGLSFPSISGSGPNGSIVHYQPEQASTCAVIDPETLYLIDSGAQYSDGTTDVTRTLYLGKGSAGRCRKNLTCSSKLDAFRAHYTLVLKGHIALATSVFPEKTPGAALDILARGPLWKFGLNYNHGTGHGVGSHLCVHEGPQGIPWLRSTLVQSAPSYLEVGLVPGMTLSNEPGYYRDGHYGIRIENLVFVKRKTDFAIQDVKGGFCEEGSKERWVDDISSDSFPESKENRPVWRDQDYCCFENLTFIPLDQRLIAKEMLNAEEIAYVDSYHEEVYEKLKPFFEKHLLNREDTGTTSYTVARLREMTKPLGEGEGGAFAADDVNGGAKRRKKE